MTVLIVTNSNDSTTDFVVNQFAIKKVPFFRLNTDKFLTEASYNFDLSSQSRYKFELELQGVQLDFNSISAVWFRRPVDPIPDLAITYLEAVNFCVIEANYVLRNIYQFLENKIWVSHPKSIAYANVKLHQLDVARKLGFTVPRSICTNNPDLALKFISTVGNTIIKPFRANSIDTGNTTALIYTSRVDDNAIKNIASIKFAPHFFQEEIVKIKEYRVTVIGKEAFITSIDSQSDPNLKLDWRSSTDKAKLWITDDLPDEILRKCFAMVKAYGLNYGAFDFALTPEGQIVFFELNPNGQWAWQEIQLGLPMTNALIRTLGH